MIISDGILSTPVLGAGWILSAGLTYLALRTFTLRQLPKTAALAAIFFLVSLARLSVGYWSIHFIVPGLMGLTLGWQAFPVMFVCLGLQSLFFPFGGFAALGVNALIAGLPALAVGVLFSRPVAKEGRFGDAAAFLAGFLATAGATLLLCWSLALSGTLAASRPFVLLGAGTVLAVLEGVITVLSMRFLRRAAPGLLAVPPKNPSDPDLSD